LEEAADAVCATKEMNGQAGAHCSIADQIDTLGEARTVGELAARLKPILDKLAYYAVTGEGAVLEAHETWHTMYTDRLYEAAGADRTAALATAGLPSTSTQTVIRRGGPHADHEKGRTRGARAPGKHSASAEGGFGDSDERLPLAPPSNRPRADNVPASLRAIMDGTHPSLREDD
jgi:hypothetical protein